MDIYGNNQILGVKDYGLFAFMALWKMCITGSIIIVIILIIIHVS